MAADDGFCEECSAALGLHYDEDDCEGADAKARLLDSFWRLGR